VQYDTVVAVNRRLQLHIEFLTDLFATRDANNRREIERLEAIAVNQGNMITWFKAQYMASAVVPGPEGTNQ